MRDTALSDCKITNTAFVRDPVAEPRRRAPTTEFAPDFTSRFSIGITPRIARLFGGRIAWPGTGTSTVSRGRSGSCARTTPRWPSPGSTGTGRSPGPGRASRAGSRRRGRTSSSCMKSRAAPRFGSVGGTRTFTRHPTFPPPSGLARRIRAAGCLTDPTYRSKIGTPSTVDRRPSTPIVGLRAEIFRMSAESHIHPLD